MIKSKNFLNSPIDPLFACWVGVFFKLQLFNQFDETGIRSEVIEKQRFGDDPWRSVGVFLLGSGDREVCETYLAALFEDANVEQHVQELDDMISEAAAASKGPFREYLRRRPIDAKMLSRQRILIASPCTISSPAINSISDLSR